MSIKRKLVFHVILLTECRLMATQRVAKARSLAAMSRPARLLDAANGLLAH